MPDNEYWGRDTIGRSQLSSWLVMAGHDWMQSAFFLRHDQSRRVMTGHDLRNVIAQ